MDCCGAFGIPGARPRRRGACASCPQPGRASSRRCSLSHRHGVANPGSRSDSRRESRARPNSTISYFYAIIKTNLNYEISGVPPRGSGVTRAVSAIIRFLFCASPARDAARLQAPPATDQLSLGQVALSAGKRRILPFASRTADKAKAFAPARTLTPPRRQPHAARAPRRDGHGTRRCHGYRSPSRRPAPSFPPATSARIAS
jgi:hypothetical protein